MCDSGNEKVWVWHLTPDLVLGEFDHLVFRADREDSHLLECIKQTIEFMGDDKDCPAEPHEIKLELVQMRENELVEMEENA